MSSFQLAQLNIAALREPLESPSMAGFVANLERINALAERSAGYIWRLKDDTGDATSLRPFGDRVIVNMSVWMDVESLRRFAFESAHVEIFRRRREWFDRMSNAYSVLWWVPQGHRPTEHEAAGRLEHLRANGATAHAFTFKDTFPRPQLDEMQGAS
ncbi:MAG: DUF3291 domain-containing protein [Proteobacteria bacterium]|nr:DUF3291 domain-containing protein [Pseudomonadota bacterium]